jgi:hypothetical protein
MTDPQPSLLRAVDRPESELGSCAWDRDHNADLLTVSGDGTTVEWGPRKPTYTGKYYPPAWVPAITRLALHSGSFRWDFVVEEMARAQIGIGFLLLWNVGPDWGFYGYLGASSTAWSYDPSTGDVVTRTASIEGGLPRFADGRRGRVSVELELPRQGAGRGRFVIDGTASSWIGLSESAVVLPAACLLRETQRVSLAQFERR